MVEDDLPLVESKVNGRRNPKPFAQSRPCGAVHAKLGVSAGAETMATLGIAAE
jgi:hypothetical protein